jgi:hypothetical protein
MLFIVDFKKRPLRDLPCPHRIALLVKTARAEKNGTGDAKNLDCVVRA